jgi:hypothetical protein
MNLNLANSEESTPYLNILLANGFKSILDVPTRDNSYIDHVFENCEKIKVEAALLNLQITDHAMIQIDFSYKGKNIREVSAVDVKVVVDERKFLAFLKDKDWDWLNKIDELTDANQVFKRLK